MIDTTRNVFNFAPNLDLRIRFSKVSQLRMTYRGRSSQIEYGESVADCGQLQSAECTYR